MLAAGAGDREIGLTLHAHQRLCQHERRTSRHSHCVCIALWGASRGHSFRSVADALSAEACRLKETASDTARTFLDEKTRS